jgi:hypothetical protein
MRQVEAAFHVAVGIVPPLILCIQVPPEANVKLDAVEVIKGVLPPADPSRLIVPVTVVKLFVALYSDPSTTAVNFNVPAIDIVMLVPEKAMVIDLVPVPDEPCSVKVLPLPIELPVLSIVMILPPPEAVKETVAEPLIVRLLIVIVGPTSTKIAAFVLISTSCAEVGTKFKLQFAALFQ